LEQKLYLQNIEAVKKNKGDRGSSMALFELERLLEGVHSVSKSKMMVLVVAEAYASFTVKTKETKEKW